MTMRRYILLAALLAIIPGCDQRTITIEVIGDGQRAYVSHFIKRTEKYDSEKSRQAHQPGADYLNKQLTETPGEKLEKDATVTDLPVRITEDLGGDDHLHVYCKPFAATADVMLKIYKDGKLVRTHILKPDDMGVYLNL